MEITCKYCNATYHMPDDKVPTRKASAECKRCGNPIVINTGHIIGSPAASGPVPAKSDVTASDHGLEILNAFPEISSYAADHYDFFKLLKANKKGDYRTRLNKLKMKILAVVKSALDQLLEKDEKVFGIAGGTAYHPIEILLGNGWLTMLYNRYAIVATNQRLVMVHTNHRMTRTGHYLSQMAYEQIRKVTRGLFRTSLTLKPKKGKRRTFTSMKAALTGEMRDLILARMEPEKAPAAQPREHLCPACFSPLVNKLAQCSVCHVAFKTPKEAAFRSLILPGWGDFYLGHRFLGCLEMAGSMLLWLLALSMLGGGNFEDLAVMGFLILFYNGFDALLTRHMAQKGYMLTKKKMAEEQDRDYSFSPAGSRVADVKGA